MSTTRHELSFAWNGLQLAGTLHLPASVAPYPAVLMLQGSGEADRDNNGYFPSIRDAFLAYGLAVYSFDKPGVGGSSGDWRDYALEGRASQADAALDALRARPEIDAARLGVWGHSQGGWVVQMLAGRAPELAFAVTSSGPSINGELQNLYGCEHTMRAAGHVEADIQHALEFIEQIHAAAHANEAFESVEQRLLATAREQVWYGYLDVEDAATWEHVGRFVREAFEPLEALSTARCPVLAVFGGLDQLVPASQSAAECGQTLARAGNPDPTVLAFPTGDHRMQDAAGQLVPGYTALLASWAARRAGPS